MQLRRRPLSMSQQILTVCFVASYRIPKALSDKACKDIKTKQAAAAAAAKEERRKGQSRVWCSMLGKNYFRLCTFLSETKQKAPKQAVLLALNMFDT